MMCQQVTELMTEAMEGSLVGVLKARFHVHLALCPYCKAYRRQLETTIATLRRLPPPEPSDSARARALAAFRARKRDPV